MRNMRILIGSVVNQKSAIFMQFLTGLKELNKDGLDADFYFIDSNLDKQVSAILNKLARTNKRMQVATMGADITASKNNIVQYAKEYNYDYLFLVNSDLVLYPDTLQHLLSQKKDIVSEVFYTELPQRESLPVRHAYDYFQSHKDMGSNELVRYIQKLKTTDILDTNVIGDCTLFSKRVLQAGVTFHLLEQDFFLKDFGEACNGVVSDEYTAYVDTRMPAYHIYSEAELYKVSDYIEAYKARKYVEEKDTMLKHLIESEEQVCYPTVVAIDKKLEAGVVEYYSGVARTWYQGKMKKANSCWELVEFAEKPAEESNVQQETNVKKKITLIYNRRSGSDSVALYKAMPMEIKEKYNVQLVRENINSQHYFHEIKTSDVLIITDANYTMNKTTYNPNQIILNLWHGFPLKAMFFTDGNARNNGEWSKFWKHFDYMTSYSPLYNELIHTSMKIDPERFVITGQPRNDYLFNRNSRDLLFRLIQCEGTGKRLIFYTPTFRAVREICGNEGERNWDNLFGFQDFDMNRFQKFLGENNLEVIAKLHPNEEHLYKSIIEKMDGIHLLTEEILEKEDVHSYEVLGAADLLITDYSSIYFDYLLLDKPVIFTPTDLDKYDSSRGFSLEPYEDWTPGPKATTQQALQEEIVRSLKDSAYYGEMRKEVMDIVHTYQDANACGRVWELVGDMVGMKRRGDRCRSIKTY